MYCVQKILCWAEWNLNRYSADTVHSKVDIILRILDTVLSLTYTILSLPIIVPKDQSRHRDHSAIGTFGFTNDGIIVTASIRCKSECILAKKSETNGSVLRKTEITGLLNGPVWMNCSLTSNILHWLRAEFAPSLVPLFMTISYPGERTTQQEMPLT